MHRLQIEWLSTKGRQDGFSAFVWERVVVIRGGRRRTSQRNQHHCIETTLFSGFAPKFLPPNRCQQVPSSTSRVSCSNNLDYCSRTTGILSDSTDIKGCASLTTFGIFIQYEQGLVDVPKKVENRQTRKEIRIVALTQIWEPQDTHAGQHDEVPRYFSVETE